LARKFSSVFDCYFSTVCSEASVAKLYKLYKAIP
jgi:hypothetical protein